MTYERKIVPRRKPPLMARMLWRDARRRRLRWPFSAFAPVVPAGYWR